MTKQKPAKNTGTKRILMAFTYTFSGLKHALKDEPAFLQEFCLFTPLLIAMIFMPLGIELKLLLFVTSIFVLIVELLNSAIESVVDMVSPEYHDLAKQAKDMGSAAVFLSFVASGAVWLYAIFKLIMKYSC